jgi:hypothetical protein
VRALTERFYYWYTGVDDWTDAYSRVIAIDGEEAMIQSEHFYLAPLTGESSGEESGGSISSHIAGSFTVKIIPHSSAQLNPDNEVFCRRLPHVKDIGPDQEAELTEIPVLLAGVPPWTLEYSVLDYQTSEEKIITVSFDASVDSDVGNYPTDRHSKIFRRFTINGSVPGSYRLRSLGDAKGPGTVSLDPVGVSVCPEAFWSRNATHELIRPDFTLIVRSLPLEKELCRLDGGYLELFAYGVPPLTVSYIRHIGGKAPRDGDNITISHVESGNPAEIS